MSLFCLFLINSGKKARFDLSTRIYKNFNHDLFDC